MNHYTFRTIIEPDENNTYHGWVPILRGCHTCGDSIEETKKNLKEAIEVYILSLQEDGEPIPQENGMESFETISMPDVMQPKKQFLYA
ncbi:MAG: type II toxin-antitoxin system HicB family antitoxin [Patescibacteria group bacterium]